ncbi:MAG: transposase [Deltaproteobacteria bacterium]|nr:transposase [Deltaproteobacteria bacterium]
MSDFVGIVHGRTAIGLFNRFSELKQKHLWDNHFWSRGYSLDTVGLDAEMIRKCVKYPK